MTENAFPSDAAENRRLVQADADDLNVLIPESVLSKRKQVIGHGCPRYRAGPYLRPASDFPSRGIIRVVPRICDSSLKPHGGLGAFLFLQRKEKRT